MKKLLAILVLATLTITATFASSENRNVRINGSVSKTEYTFSLNYDGNDLNDADTIAGNFDLSIESVTKAFTVRRTAGNLNKDLGLKVSITSGPFKGKFNNKNNYSTGIIPKLNVLSTSKTSFKSIDLAIDKTSGILDYIIPAGSNSIADDLLIFQLIISGNADVPAGSYVSTIVIDYTYEQ